MKKEGGTFFVTFRLSGSLPPEVLLQLKLECEQILQQALEREQLLQQPVAAKRPLTRAEQERSLRWHCERLDAHLDAGHGECLLRQPEVAIQVCEALRFFAGQLYELHAWVVMPNHVHAVVWPRPPELLGRVLHSLKSYTATQANKISKRAGQSFWDRGSYAHLIRDDDDRARCTAYSVNNPVSARLCARPEDWPWSSAYRPSAGT